MSLTRVVRINRLTGPDPYILRFRCVAAAAYRSPNRAHRQIRDVRALFLWCQLQLATLPTETKRLVIHVKKLGAIGVNLVIFGVRLVLLLA